MVGPVQPDILDIVPEHVAEPVRRPRWRERVVAGGRDAALSLLLNGAVLAGLVGVGFPLRSVKSPDAISVELVPHMPGSETEHAGSGTKAGGGAPLGQAKPADADRRPTAPEVAKDATPPEAPPAQALPPDAEAAAVQPAAPEPPVEPQGQEASTAPAEDHSAAKESVPPPPDHLDADPRPHLVEAPSPLPATEPIRQPQPAPGTPGPAQSAAAASATPPSPPASAPSEAASPAQRPVQSAPESEDAVPTPAPPPEAPKPLTAEERRQAANTATLAAMLPFGGGIAGNPFTAQSPVSGQGSSSAYRGQVYANFNKAQDIIADAKARHLKGQAVVAFTIDDHGNLASLGIAVSSRNPEVDQAALELIRRAAPFPPPPPGAQRSFAPAIGLGLDD